MSSILKGLNESYFNRDEQDQQNAMDTRRRSDLSGERNAGLNEPDELPTTPQQSRNGVYEYNVPTGQEKIAQELGLQLHKGHWFCRVPVQRANFQFGRPQFHEIPSKNVSEAEQDYGPEYQDKVQRLGQMAKQGERKTVWDPVKRVYKTVPVNPPKEQGVAEGSDYSEEPNLSKMSVDELKNHIEELTNAATEMFGIERAYIRMDIDKAKSMLRRKLKQGVAEAEIDRPGMKDGRPYSDSLRRHPGNSSYMTPEYLIQKYQDELAKIEAGPYKRPKDVAMYKARIAKLQRQQGVAEGTGDKKFDDMMKRVAKKPTQAQRNAERIRQKKEREAETRAHFSNGGGFGPSPADKLSIRKQGVAEGVAETLPMDDAVKVLRQYGADHFKTTSNELHFYKQGRPFSVDLIWGNEGERSVNLSQLNSATRQLKGQGVAEEKQRLDPSCWKGYKKQGTKMKGDTRVNNCVPKESAIMKGLVDENRQGDK